MPVIRSNTLAVRNEKLWSSLLTPVTPPALIMEQIIRSLSPFFLFNNRHCCPFVPRNDSFQPATDLIRFAHDSPLIYYGMSSSLLSERLNFEIVICYRIRFIIRLWMWCSQEMGPAALVSLVRWIIVNRPLEWENILHDKDTFTVLSD